jgi:hypothetical protein
MGKILEIRESSAKTIEINGAISPSTASGGGFLPHFNTLLLDPTIL